MRRLELTILMLVSILSFSYAQMENASEKDVFDTKEIVFYGYDYTHFKLADVKRMDEDIKKFVFTWIGFCEEHITEKKLQSWFNKEKISWCFEPTLALNKKLKSEDLVSVTKHSISSDSIQSYIYKYKISEKKGVGFVIILECFDNASKKTSGYFTFFDIASKKVLMSDYISSKDGNSYNRVSDWGSAIIIAFKKYLPLYNGKQKLY